MSTIPDSAKSMGMAAPVLLVLALVCWLLMLGSMASWIGKTPVPGRETDRIVSQAYTGGFALLSWIFLAGLLLVATCKDVVPDSLGVVAWLVHPLSVVAALGAIAILYEPQRRWPAIVPAVLPLLIAGYALYAFFPRGIPIATVGSAVWSLVALLSLAMAPVGISFQAAHRDDGSISATPGPELDSWEAKQRERRRKDELDQLRQFDDETKLYEVDRFIQPESPILNQWMDFVRHMPHREADVIQMLSSGDDRPMRYLADIDLQPTPEVCTAGRQWIHGAVEQRLRMANSGPESFVGAEFENGVSGLAWLAKNCDCDQELGELEAYVRKQDVEAPVVKKFLESLLAIREKK